MDVRLEAFCSIVSESGSLFGVRFDDLESGCASLTVDGVETDLLLDTRPAGAGIILHCHLGTLPPGRELEIYRLVLDAHRYWSAGEGWSIGVDAETGEMSLSYGCSLAGLTASALASEIDRLCGIATGWKAAFAPEEAAQPEETPEYETILV